MGQAPTSRRGAGAARLAAACGRGRRLATPETPGDWQDDLKVSYRPALGLRPRERGSALTR